MSSVPNLIAVVILVSVITSLASSATCSPATGAEPDIQQAVLLVAIAAFAGAFFAFVFTRIGHALTTAFERKRAAYNSLIRLQKYLQDALYLTERNVAVVDEFLRVFPESSGGMDQHPIFIHQFNQYNVYDELLFALTTLDLVNDLYSLNKDLSTLNVAMATIDRSYAQAVDAFLNRKIEVADYRDNIAYFRGRHSEIKKHLSHLRPDLLRLFAIVRLMAKSRPLSLKLVIWVSQQKYDKKLLKGIPDEVKSIESTLGGDGGRK